MLHGWLWVTTFTGVVALTVFALPLAALTVCLLALRRRTALAPWRSALADVGMVYGTVPSLWLILLPGERPGEVIGRVSLMPLRDLSNIVHDGAWLAIVGNLLVFAALGFFAPLRFPQLASARRMLAVGTGLSVLVEMLQFALMLDRVSSVDDVLLNGLGCGLAALASRPWWRAPAPRDQPTLTVGPSRYA